MGKERRPLNWICGREERKTHLKTSSHVFNEVHGTNEEERRDKTHPFNQNTPTPLTPREAGPHLSTQKGVILPNNPKFILQ